MMGLSYSLSTQLHSIDIMVDGTVGKCFAVYCEVVSLCNGPSWFPFFCVSHGGDTLEELVASQPGKPTDTGLLLLYYRVTTM